MAWAAVASAAVSVGGSLLAGSNSSGAAQSAADAQIQSAGTATAEQRREYDQTRTDTAPYRQAGSAASKRLAQLLGIGTVDVPGQEKSVDYNGQKFSSIDELRNDLIADFVRQGGNPGTQEYQTALDNVLSRATPSAGQTTPYTGADSGSLLKKFSTEDLNSDPVYSSGLQFGLDEGTKAINARAVGSGTYDSGATLKALTKFGNDYGSTKANESFNRYNATNDSIYNKLAGVSGSGQVATAQTNAAGANMVNNVSNDITSAGNARAAGIVGGANAWGSAAGGVNNAIQGYQSNQTLQALLKRNQTSDFSPYASQYNLSNPQYG